MTEKKFIYIVGTVPPVAPVGTENNQNSKSMISPNYSILSIPVMSITSCFNAMYAIPTPCGTGMKKLAGTGQETLKASSLAPLKKQTLLPSSFSINIENTNPRSTSICIL